MNIEQEVQSAMPALMARIRSEALDRIEREAVNAATVVAVEAAKQWATEHLVPEIKAQLEAGKGGMTKAAKDAADSIGDAVAKAMLKHVTEKLTQSWNVKKVVEALF